MDAYIALGSNLGDREGMLAAATRSLATLGTVTAASSVYETEPVGYLDQPRYLNAVVALQTDLDPGTLLARLLAIERELGRTREFVNAPRTIDLDLLLMGDLVVESAALTLPHPRLHERAFVLAPLREIAGEVVHPVLGRTVDALYRGLQDTSGVYLSSADLLQRG